MILVMMMRRTRQDSFLSLNFFFSFEQLICSFLQSINGDDEQQQQHHQFPSMSLDENSSEYIQRPEVPYPILQSTRIQSHLNNGHVNNNNNNNDNQNDDQQSNINEHDSSMINDEMDIYLKSMSPYKHQAYLIDDILQSVFNKFLLSQQQSEQRLISFFTEQKHEDQLREERIHREQRQHQYELVQLILNQGRDIFCSIRNIIVD